MLLVFVIFVSIEAILKGYPLVNLVLVSLKLEVLERLVIIKSVDKIQLI